MSKTSINKQVSQKKVFLAILIGLSITILVAYFIFQNENIDELKSVLSQINFNSIFWFWIVMALVFMLGRDLAYSLRLRFLTQKKLEWKSSIRAIFLWEFASALSPGAVGGSSVAMFILNREGLKLGESTTIVLLTSILDNIFYIVFLPLVVSLVGSIEILPEDFEYSALKQFIWIGYFMVLTFTIFLITILFFKPNFMTRTMRFISKFVWFKKYGDKINSFLNNLISSSDYFKTVPIKEWLKIFVATCLSWISRFLVVNALFMAFININFFDNLIVFSRQIFMWVILIIPSLPGGSGIAELSFTTFFEDFASPSSFIFGIALIWRLISYYPYLIIGSILLSNWKKRELKK